jgi:hypothetical protein
MPLRAFIIDDEPIVFEVFRAYMQTVPTNVSWLAVRLRMSPRLI